MRAAHCSLSVLAKDDYDEPTLLYKWTADAGVTFSDNNSNTAKNCTATFPGSGSYTCTATATDVDSATAASSVEVAVP